MENEKLYLSELTTGSRAMIFKVHGHGGFCHRVLDLGFVRGEEVRVVKNSPFMDPVEYEIMGSHVSLRRSEAKHIEVISLDENAHPDNVFHGTIEEHVREEMEQRSKEIMVALVGNPNCGKTSFFNYATGLHEKVGNYAGVTKDSKVGTFIHRGYTINLVDLPGTYALSDFSSDELFVRDFLSNEHPDVVLNIVDAGNLERNLFLTTQLIDRNPRMVMGLNMYDELEKSGKKLDYEALGKMLGFPIVPVVSTTGLGIEEVLEQIVEVYEGEIVGPGATEFKSKHIHINYGEDVETAIREIKKLIYKDTRVHADYPGRYMALRLLENDQRALKELADLANFDAICQKAAEQRQRLEKEYKDDISSILSGLKYGFIRGALSETLTLTQSNKVDLAYAVDRVLTNRWLGLPVLILFMWLMFEATFGIGGYLQHGLQWAIDAFASWLTEVMPAGMLKDLLIDGIVAGVGGVLVFLPNILILFLFISLLEDTGYMARAAFIMDRLMRRMGLHGKSFIPYIIGFGCSVPAVMATRTLENPKDRLLTMLTVPFMSCSTRLTVYVLLVSAFFSEHQALILLALYALGIGVAVLTSLGLNKLVFKNGSDHFVMELPPYRIPTFKSVVSHMWDKGKQYLQNVSTVILLASIIIWGLGYFPRADVDFLAPNNTESVAQNNVDFVAQNDVELVAQNNVVSVASDAPQNPVETTYLNLSQTSEISSLKNGENLSQISFEETDANIAQSTEKSAKIATLQASAMYKSHQLEQSYIGRIGKALEPVFRPIGLAWQEGVALLCGCAGKEIIISSLEIFYEGDLAANSGLTPLSAFAMLVFILLYFPCVATMVAIAKESNWRWAAFSAIYSTALAWLLAFAIFQLGSLF